jgi:iron complex outermembrane receptor protein
MVASGRLRARPRLHLFCAAAAASLLASAAWAQSTPSAAGAPAAIPRGVNSVEEVIVTAQRREERSQDVPISITAFSQERLQQQNIAKPQDLQASVPSLTVGSVGQGSRESQTYTLRGQGATFQSAPGVVVYMNEVPLPAAVSLSQQGGPGTYLDLENMQILAGPQGTLFGRNTTGGAILLVPRKPTNDFSGYIEGRVGNYSDREALGAINVPLVPDRLLVRLAAQYQSRDGYTYDATFNKYRDNVHYWTARLGVTFRPNASFENYTMVYGTFSKNNGTGLIAKGFNIEGLQAVGFCVDPPQSPPGPLGIAVSCDTYRAAIARANALGPRATALGIDEYQRTATGGILNTTTINIGPDLTLRNILSLQQLSSNYLYDGDATPFQQYDVGVVAGHLPPGYLNGFASSAPRDNLREGTEELQLQGKALDHHLVYTVGAFYYDQQPAGVQGSFGVSYCPVLFTGFCPNQPSYSGVKNISRALYAQASLDFGAVSSALDSLRLTVGYRYTWDRISGFADAFTPQFGGTFLCSNTNEVVAAAAECTFTGSLRSSAPTWTAGLDYKPLEGLLVYLKSSRGYKAGGFNPYSVRPTTRTFAPEFVTDYEGGFKWDWRLADMPGRLNATYYYLNYKNIQRATGDFNIETLASGARTLSARAHIQGVEIEALLKPTPHLEIGGNFSYTDAKYDDYHYTATAPTPDCSGAVIPAGGLADASCIPFQYVAPRIYSVHLAYNQPLAGDLGELALFLSWSRSSAQYTEAIQLPSVQPGAWLEPFGLLNISLDWNNIAGRKVDLGFFMTNALNKLYRISNSDVFQQGSLLAWNTIYGEPRMFGARLRYHFGP